MNVHVKVQTRHPKLLKIKEKRKSYGETFCRNRRAWDTLSLVDRGTKNSDHRLIRKQRLHQHPRQED